MYREWEDEMDELVDNYRGMEWTPGIVARFNQDMKELARKYPAMVNEFTTGDEQRISTMFYYATDALEDFNRFTNATKRGVGTLMGTLSVNNYMSPKGITFSGKKNLRIHAELVDAAGTSPVVYETDTKTGFFRMTAPKYYGDRAFFLSVADPSKFKPGQPYTWIQTVNDKQEDRRKGTPYIPRADYDARIIYPYPNFVKPYDYYQTRLPVVKDTVSDTLRIVQNDGTTVMPELTKTAKWGRLQKFNDEYPAVIMDAGKAWNLAFDAGTSWARFMIGDMGLDFPYVTEMRDFGEAIKTDRVRERLGLSPVQRMLPQYRDVPLDSIYSPKYLATNGTMPKYINMHDKGSMDSIFRQTRLMPEDLKYFERPYLDKYMLYTDYCPRMEGSKRYWGSNLPETYIAKYPFYDGAKRAVYRDRCLVLPGFAYPAEFYSPNYSNHVLPEGEKDYRRTIYWNPDLKLDNNGEAHVTLYNNSRTTPMHVEVQGQCADGTLLWTDK